MLFKEREKRTNIEGTRVGEREYEIEKKGGKAKEGIPKREKKSAIARDKERTANEMLEEDRREGEAEG